MSHTYYKDRRTHVTLTGGPVILKLDTPLGEAEICCTYNGIIFNKEVPDDLKDVINSQIEILQSKENGTLTNISVPWVDEVKNGYYTNASPKTLRVPKGFGEGYVSVIYIASPVKKEYIKLHMLVEGDCVILSEDEDMLECHEAFMSLTKNFIYETKGKKLNMKVADPAYFVDTLIDKIGGNWFMPFMNYTTDDECTNAVVLHSADEIDTITLVSEKESDRHHIYMGDNNYREFESIPDSFVIDNHIDGTIHYARKRDYLAVLMTKNKVIEYALVYNGTDTRFTGSHTRQELRDANGIPVDLRDFSFGRKLPTLKEAIDELIKTHRKHKMFIKEGYTSDTIKEIQKTKKAMAKGSSKFPTLMSMFGNKK